MLRVIVSSNFDERYLEFWPFVAKAWKSLFQCEVTLALLWDGPRINDYSPAIVSELNKYGSVKLFFPLKGIPTSNLSKVIRFICASYYTDDICMMNDIDLLPLQNEYYLKHLMHLKEDHLIMIGTDTYNGTPDEGKVPFGYLTATGKTFNRIFNPNNMKYSDLVQSWVGLHVFDKKEDISLNIHNENPNTFSDESLLRALIHKNNFTNTQGFPRGFQVGVDSIDRSCWKIDMEKLRRNEYIESHMLRPYNKNREQLDILFKHLGVL